MFQCVGSVFFIYELENRHRYCNLKTRYRLEFAQASSTLQQWTLCEAAKNNAFVILSLGVIKVFFNYSSQEYCVLSSVASE
jgi:hypothetical protein